MVYNGMYLIYRENNNIMLIKFVNHKTSHILIRIYPYALPGIEDEFLDFGFLYFHLSDMMKHQIEQFNNDWRSGELRISNFPIVIDDAILIPTSVVENSDNMNNTDYKHIKYDSISHLNSRPTFGKYDRYYAIQGTILCNLDYFNIVIERVPEGFTMPLIIYRAHSYFNRL